VPVLELLGSFDRPVAEADGAAGGQASVADAAPSGAAFPGGVADAGHGPAENALIQSYRRFMSEPEEAVEAAGADGGGADAVAADSVAEDSPPRSQLPSDDHFFNWLRRHTGKPPATVTVDQVIQAVAKKMGVDRKRLLSTSRERRLTLTRALIGWHVTKNQIATLTEVSRQLGRDPSSVYTAYARYRAWRPQLFRDSLATILQYLDNDEAAKKH
jgi:Bacterial dnaA protein helix-turn-helix